MKDIIFTKMNPYFYGHILYIGMSNMGELLYFHI